MNMEVVLDGLFNSNDTYDYNLNYEYNDVLGDKKAVWIPALYSVVMIVGLLGNGLILCVLAQRWRVWSISDTFILYLSLADILLLGTLSLWIAQATQDGGWSFGVFLCKFGGAVFNISFYCGVFLLACISLDRYLYTVHATRLVSLANPRSAHICCLLAWLISLFLTIPDWIFLEVKGPWQEGQSLCIPNHYFSERQLVSRLFHHILGFAATLFICCLHGLIWFQRSSKNLQKPRVTILLLVMVAVFSLCWIPYNIVLTMDTFWTSSKLPEKTHFESSLKTPLMVTSALACVHACLRPMLYFGLCKNLRKWTLSWIACARVELKGGMWELGLEEETLPSQSHEGEALKQISCVEHQVQSTQS